MWKTLSNLDLDVVTWGKLISGGPNVPTFYGTICLFDNPFSEPDKKAEFEAVSGPRGKQRKKHGGFH